MRYLLSFLALCMVLAAAMPADARNRHHQQQLCERYNHGEDQDGYTCHIDGLQCDVQVPQQREETGIRSISGSRGRCGHYRQFFARYFDNLRFGNRRRQQRFGSDPFDDPFFNQQRNFQRQPSCFNPTYIDGVPYCPVGR